ncbi:hypothetical protein SLS62_004260 [Diatrype stigma]|uniref:Rieske domain-containing protein n=1 Tax=Diatrype stigma TaxID=117547 RepID=A0AAN9URB2_9PEZI
MPVGRRKRVVVVGLGMVGIAFIEKLLKLDARAREYDVVVIGEEPHLAYNRVGLTGFFQHRKVENLYLNPEEWYASHAPENKLSYHLNTLVTSIDPSSKTVACANGDAVSYDILVLATGSDAVLPTRTPGHDARGVFVYRTIDDLRRLIAHGEAFRGQGQGQGATGAGNGNGTAVVVGGGLLGLEAAHAMLSLQAFERVKLVERNRWVLSRQLDAEAGALVVEKVTELGVDVLLGKRVAKIETDEVMAGEEEEDEEKKETRNNNNNRKATGIVFEDGERMDCSTICFAIGVRPRDSLARSCAGLQCAGADDLGGGSGGILVGDDLRTSVPDVYAIGECASWSGQTFGLIAPGIEMADVLAFNLTQAKLHHQPRAFRRPDLSTKLKLLGVDVASFGDFFADRDGPRSLPAKARAKAKAAPQEVKALTYKDPFAQVYKKYLFTADGKYLLGGMMIGDTSDYVKLVALIKSQKELEIPPAQLILGAGKKGGGDGDDDDEDLDDDAQVCSCHNVSKGDLVRSVKNKEGENGGGGGGCKTVGEVKACTKAGTGCGGCMPLVTGIVNRALRDLGAEVTNHVCAHFSHSRAELYHIVMARRLTTLAEVMAAAGNDAASDGCEACKPVVASLFASLWNRHVMERPTHGLQDTNDRYLGNLQRNGTFSVVPRVSAGEITPDRLIAIGEVARRYDLYTKITGGQRIDMFGARKQDLPDIWRRLVAAGLESGHAYAKSLRTVKSCVGTTWCRYGVGDSVGMAVRVEERYKSIRSPHKIKGGVSGCVRECAEAQSKDFGLIATEKGWNIFVGGNGGAKPRHAELLAKDVAPSEVIPILDRYLMFYIRTADRLQRTARWMEQLSSGEPGSGSSSSTKGLAYLRQVILEDKLGICASLEAQMQELVDSFFDEWAEALRDPAIASKFRQFANTDASVDGVEIERDRGQPRPAFWPNDSNSNTNAGAVSKDAGAKEEEGEDGKGGGRRSWTSLSWQPVIEASHFAGADATPNGISAAIKRGDTQLALWRVRGRYYATQQMCPHKRAFALSDGLIGQDIPPPSSSKPQNEVSCGDDDNDREKGPSPYVSCPFHKRNFDLTSGSCRNDPAMSSIATFDVEERAADGLVYLRLPPVEELDAALGTTRWMVRKGEPGAAAAESAFADLDRKIGFGQEKGEDGHRRRGRARKPGAGPSADLPMRRPVELLAGGGGCGGAPEW